MHMIVVGCGRVGSTIALELQEKGHDVVVVDRREDAFRRLGDDFRGRTVTGIGFDRVVLRRAGITAESSVMAVTSGDNSNILVARVAREMFGVQRVVARIYDPRRAAVYQRLGISTVATVAWASRQILTVVLPHESTPTWTDPTSSHVMIEKRVPSSLAGRRVEDIVEDRGSVVLVTRLGGSSIPVVGAIVQQDDVLHILTPAESVDAVDARFSSRTEVGS
ncbi:MAG: TrkA family potassium uptake protein [Acidimicrobiia bacterium]|nr:TrkA family potassium uptake protein [Acidimicrobiia bacterium]